MYIPRKKDIKLLNVLYNNGISKNNKFVRQCNKSAIQI